MQARCLYMWSRLCLVSISAWQPRSRAEQCSAGLGQPSRLCMAAMQMRNMLALIWIVR